MHLSNSLRLNSYSIPSKKKKKKQYLKSKRLGLLRLQETIEESDDVPLYFCLTQRITAHNIWVFHNLTIILQGLL